MRWIFHLLLLRPAMRRVCAWCQRDLGVIACRWRNVGMVSHGICDECSARWLAEDTKQVRPTLDEAREHLARVVADFPFPSLNGAAAAQAVSTPAGAQQQPLQVNGTATPDAFAPAVMDNPSGGPAASFIPSDGIWSWLDRLIKRFTTKGGRNV